MDQITDLRELLKHELKDLYSAETQIINGLPKMIEKARNPQLKKALSDHLKVTREQKNRLDKIEEVLNYKNDKKEEEGGFFANLFKSKEGEQHCKAMEGIIKEAESLIKEDMAPEVMDAAIIAAAQKIEHYEIGSYGTARAYAEQMELKDVEAMLRKTLDEEYFADDSLTRIALSKVNISAENAGDAKSNGMAPAGNKENGRQAVAGKSAAKKKTVSSSGKGKSASNASKSPGKTTSKPAKNGAAPAGKKASSTSASKKQGSKKSTSGSNPKAGTATKKNAVKKAASKAPSKKSASTKSGTRKPAAQKAAAKKSPIKKGAKKKSAPKKAAPKKSGTKATNKKPVAKKTVKKAAPKKGHKKAAPKKTVAKKENKKSGRR